MVNLGIEYSSQQSIPYPTAHLVRSLQVQLQTMTSSTCKDV